MKLSDVQRLLRPLRNNLANVLSRAVVKMVDDAKKWQELQLQLGPDEVRDQVERPQQYGFTSVPLAGAEAVVAFVGGRRDHGVVLAVDDRRYRVKSLQPGEVAIYTDQGDKVVFKRGGTIEFTASTKVLINAPLVECSTDLKVSGKLDVTGKGTFSGAVDVGTTLTATTDVSGGGKSLKNHVHSVNLTGGTTASSCTAGGATGTTGGSVTSAAPS